MDTEQERALVERAKNDAEAFGELYDKYYSKIFNYILRRTANIVVAQDTTSEVFFKALKNLNKFQWQGVPFSSWLYRIATHEIANHFRKSKRSTIVMNISDAAVPSNPSPETEVLQAEAELRKYEDLLTLHDSITKLPLKYQEVITLRFFEDKPIREIGEILEKREGTIKSLLHRGLKRLKILME